MESTWNRPSLRCERISGESIETAGNRKRAYLGSLGFDLWGLGFDLLGSASRRSFGAIVISSRLFGGVLSCMMSTLFATTNSGLEPRRFMAKKPVKCPQCGASKIAWISYGMPSYSKAMVKELDAERIILGGCCLRGDDPIWHCNACEHRWGNRDFPDSLA